MVTPILAGDALRAVQHRGSHLQIIASAGSGKTEVVSQRVADLLAGGVPAEGIVAFTFTERAAAELRHRIAERAEDRMGRGVANDQATGLPKDLVLYSHTRTGPSAHRLVSSVGRM